MEVEFRKCKICKIKFRGYKQNGIWVSRFCPYCRSIKKLDKKAKTKTTKRYQRKEIKTLSAKAWRLFAQTIKKEAMNFQEYIECYTCYKMFKIGHINAGHFKHRRGLKYTAIILNLNILSVNVFTVIREGTEWLMSSAKD